MISIVTLSLPLQDGSNGLDPRFWRVSFTVDFQCLYIWWSVEFVDETPVIFFWCRFQLAFLRLSRSSCQILDLVPKPGFIAW